MNKKNRGSFVNLVALLCFAAGLAGCSATAPPVKPDVFWPPPPAPAKLQWVTTFYSQHSFEKDAQQLALEKFVGKAPADRLAKPLGVAADGEGRVYVSDLDFGHIRILDFNAKQMDVFKKERWASGLLGLAYDSQGRLYAADGASGYISVFDAATREKLFSFGGHEYLQQPANIALNESLGRVYVTDSTAHKVVAFDSQGGYLFSFGEKGGGLGQLYAPVGVAVGPKGNVYVSEFLNTRIHVFDADGKPLRFFGERGDREWQFEGPRGLAFTSDGYLVIAEARKAALAIYDPEKGVPMLFLGGKASNSPLGFVLPSAVFVDKNDRIYVTDSLGKAVAIWQYLSPRYFQKHPLIQEKLDVVEQELRSKGKIR